MQCEKTTATVKKQLWKYTFQTSHIVYSWYDGCYDIVIGKYAKVYQHGEKSAKFCILKFDKPFRNKIRLHVTIDTALIHVFPYKLFLAPYILLLLQFHNTILWLFSPYPSMKDLNMVINTPDLTRNKKYRTPHILSSFVGNGSLSLPSRRQQKQR